MEYTYCRGKHTCEICIKEYDCYGENISHSGGNGSGKCHGGEIQFCPNHTLQEYVDQHYKNNEIEERFIFDFHGV